MSRCPKYRREIIRVSNTARKYRRKTDENTCGSKKDRKAVGDPESKRGVDVDCLEIWEGDVGEWRCVRTYCEETFGLAFISLSCFEGRLGTERTAGAWNSSVLS
jgi:hypothetical protein